MNITILEAHKTWSNLITAMRRFSSDLQRSRRPWNFNTSGNIWHNDLLIQSLDLWYSDNISPFIYPARLQESQEWIMTVTPVYLGWRVHLHSKMTMYNETILVYLTRGHVFPLAWSDSLAVMCPWWAAIENLSSLAAMEGFWKILLTQKRYGQNLFRVGKTSKIMDYFWTYRGKEYVCLGVHPLWQPKAALCTPALGQVRENPLENEGKARVFVPACK